MCCQKRELLSILGYLLFFILLSLHITVIVLLVMNFQFGRYTKDILWYYILQREDYYLALSVIHLKQILTELAINLLSVICIILLSLSVCCVLPKFRNLCVTWVESYSYTDYYNVYLAFCNRLNPPLPSIEIHREKHEQSSSNVDTQSSRPISIANVETDGKSSHEHERSYSTMDTQSFFPLPIPPEETHESSQERLSSLPSEVAETHNKSKQERPHRSTLNTPYLVHERSIPQIVKGIAKFRVLLLGFNLEKRIIRTMIKDIKRALFSTDKIMRTALRKKLLGTANKLNGSKFIKEAIENLFIEMQETVR